MAFIGNIVGAYAAQQIGEYNATLYNQQAAYADLLGGLPVAEAYLR